LPPLLFGVYPTLVDLGSGFGYYGDELRKHAGYLVGLDLFLPSLNVAKDRRVFDDLVCADILNLPFLMDKVDCVTLFDVIEHLRKPSGRELLSSFPSSVFISTPNSEFSNAQYARLMGNVREHHVSKWNISDLENLGFRASARDPPLWMRLLGNKGIVVAHKEESIPS
jgi:2-polyprenyl-3-methyl-5-hydroxy-6-metoxy-1,4-benzoquinol methylase